jgi:hypothetical protein
MIVQRVIGSELGKNKEIMRIRTCSRGFHNDMEVLASS